jgi:1,4-alpha-glucan branching enzyme
MLDHAEIIALCRAEHGDPYAVLGMHTDADGGLWVRSLQPGAHAVAVIEAKTGRQIAQLAQRPVEGVEGFFEGPIPRRRNSFAYRLRITWDSGVQETDDPYRFPTVLGEMDVWLLAEGSHLRPFERLGAHLCEIDGVAGTVFAVWAPDAQRVSVVGDFNTWDGRRHPMRLRRGMRRLGNFPAGGKRRGSLQVRNTLPRWPSAATQGRSLRLPGRDAAIHGVDRLCAAATRGAGVGAGG